MAKSAVPQDLGLVRLERWEAVRGRSDWPPLLSSRTGLPQIRHRRSPLPNCTPRRWWSSQTFFGRCLSCHSQDGVAMGRTAQGMQRPRLQSVPDPKFAREVPAQCVSHCKQTLGQCVIRGCRVR